MNRIGCPIGLNPVDAATYDRLARAGKYGNQNAPAAVGHARIGAFNDPFGQARAAQAAARGIPVAQWNAMTSAQQAAAPVVAPTPPPQSSDPFGQARAAQAAAIAKASQTWPQPLTTTNDRTWSQAAIHDVVRITTPPFKSELSGHSLGYPGQNVIWFQEPVQGPSVFSQSILRGIFDSRVRSNQNNNVDPNARAVAIDIALQRKEGTNWVGGVVGFVMSDGTYYNITGRRSDEVPVFWITPQQITRVWKNHQQVPPVTSAVAGTNIGCAPGHPVAPFLIQENAQPFAGIGQNPPVGVPPYGYGFPAGDAAFYGIGAVATDADSVQRGFTKLQQDFASVKPLVLSAWNSPDSMAALSTLLAHLCAHNVSLRDVASVVNARAKMLGAPVASVPANAQISPEAANAEGVRIGARRNAPHARVGQGIFPTSVANRLAAVNAQIRAAAAQANQSPTNAPSPHASAPYSVMWPNPLDTVQTPNVQNLAAVNDVVRVTTNPVSSEVGGRPEAPNFFDYNGGQIVGVDLALHRREGNLWAGGVVGYLYYNGQYKNVTGANSGAVRWFRIQPNQIVKLWKNHVLVQGS